MKDINMKIISFFLFIGSYIMAGVLLPYLFMFLHKIGAVKKNWQGNNIPGIAGIAFPFIISLASIPLLIYGLQDRKINIYLLALWGVSLLGLLDDTYGDSGPKGLKGHFKYLWQHKKLTTGVIKASGTAIITAWVIINQNKGFLDWLLLLLNVNTINLLDLRPGRAVKGTLFLLMIALIFQLQDYFLISMASGVIIAYARYDLHAKVMLGDTGSNTLGIISGLILLDLPYFAKLTLVIIFAVFHLLTEKFSFSMIIERSNILRKIDRWGQR